MFLENYEEEEFYDKFFTEDYLVNERDYSDVSDEALEFSHFLYDFLQGIIDSEYKLFEEFTSNKNAQEHFIKHCIGTTTNKSKRYTVLYDFTTVDEYIKHEQNIDTLIKNNKNSKMYITNLVDFNTIIKAIRKLFEGSQTLTFSTSCGFDNSKGRVSVSLHSWATNYTTNYLQNTIDFIVQAPDGKTITMFPVDAFYLEKQLNDELSRVNSNLKLKINH